MEEFIKKAKMILMTDSNKTSSVSELSILMIISEYEAYKEDKRVVRSLNRNIKWASKGD